MARASGKYTIKGTRLDDVIVVGTNGFTINGNPKSLTEAQVNAGLVINADTGNDVVSGGAGPDEINGARGNDMLSGGGGFDKLSGGDGDDTLIDLDVLLTDPDTSTAPSAEDINAGLGARFDGGRGIDTIDFTGSTQSLWIDLGGSINPSLVYAAGPNGLGSWSFDAGQGLQNRIAGVENIVGGDGHDMLWGNFADNEIHGGAGNDQLNGGAVSSTNPSHDKLFGDAGNDYLFGNNGNDELTGGSGIDRFIFGDHRAIDGHDIIWDYTPGEDFLSFSFEPAPTTWSATTVNGIDSLIGTYDNGASSITVVGITSSAQLSIETDFMF